MARISSLGREEVLSLTQSGEGIAWIGGNRPFMAPVTAQTGPEPGPLAGRRALVTGAARRLGRAIALRLARAGADVVVHCRESLGEAEAVAGEIRALGREASVVRADLTSERALDRLCAVALTGPGAADLLVNNASLFQPSALADLTWEHLSRSVLLNAFAPLRLMRALASSCDDGAIVNLLDARMRDYDRANVGYHVSKRMLHAFTRMAAIEFAPRVRVNAVAPGLILPPPGEDEGYLERFANANPLQAVGSADAVAEAVLYLASASFVTGQVLYVDGGRHLRGGIYDA